MIYKKGYIYKITSPSNKIYIGQAVNIDKRFARYKNLDCKSQVRIYRSLKKYGFDNHVFEIIEECDISELNVRERYWQEYYDVLNENGLNCCYAETINSPKVFSDKMIENIKNGLIGKVKKGSDHYRYGKKLTEEQKQFLSKVNKGRKQPQSFIDRMTGSNNPNYLKPLPDWHKKRLSELQKERFKDKSNHPFTGRRHSESAKQKMSIAKKGKGLSNEWAKKISDSVIKNYCQYKNKIVLDLSNGVYYYNCADAARYNNYNSTTLSHMLVGSKKNKSNLIYV